jgi:methionyl-tRNA synthetase
MGKDNITFHTVIFPSTLIGSGMPWTKLHHVSTTEFLNYELDPVTQKPLKFSKTRGVGVFGDNAMETGIPSEVWRYYLLINRPENQDTIFLWDDFVAKNNNELLANLGNFSNRLLKFVASSFKGVVPAYGSDHIHEQD